MKLPAIGFGTSRLRGQQCTELVQEAIEIGYRLIDTANRYDNEQCIGQALRASSVPRDRVIICTKLHLDTMRKADAERALHASLERLGLDYVDLLLIHWPSPVVPVAETLGAMRQFRDRGLIREFGLSNFTIPLLQEAWSVEPSIRVNQIELHPYLQQPKLVELMRAMDLQVMASRPTASGRLCEEGEIKAWARREGCSSYQLMLRWHAARGDVTAITQTTKKERLAINLSAGTQPLGGEAKRALDAMDRGFRTLDRPYAPRWDEEPLASA